MYFLPLAPHKPIPAPSRVAVFQISTCPTCKLEFACTTWTPHPPPHAQGHASNIETLQLQNLGNGLSDIYISSQAYNIQGGHVWYFVHTCAVQMEPHQAICNAFSSLLWQRDLKTPRGSSGPLGLNPINGWCQSHFGTVCLFTSLLPCLHADHMLQTLQFCTPTRTPPDSQVSSQAGSLSTHKH